MKKKEKSEGGLFHRRSPAPQKKAVSTENKGGQVLNAPTITTTATMTTVGTVSAPHPATSVQGQGFPGPPAAAPEGLHSTGGQEDSATTQPHHPTGSGALPHGNTSYRHHHHLHQSSIKDNASDTTDVDLGSEQGEDMGDGRGVAAMDPLRARTAIEQVKVKLDKTKTLITKAQGIKEDNVNEYLRLSDSQAKRANNTATDRTQMQRIKGTFERKNKESTDEIERLQRKYEGYRKKLSALERAAAASATGANAGPAGAAGTGGGGGGTRFIKSFQGLKELGANLKEGVSGLGSLATKPRELASMVKSKFGSADNLSSNQGPGSGAGTANHGPGAGTSASAVSAPSASQGGGGGSEGGGDPTLDTQSPALLADGPGSPGRGTLPPNFKLTLASEEGSLKAGDDDGSGAGGPANGSDMSSPGPCCRCSCGGGKRGLGSEGRLEQLTSDLAKCPVIKELEQAVEQSTQENYMLKEQLSELEPELEGLKTVVSEYQYRCARLEEGLNDLGELYQNRLSNMERDLSASEEKVAYQLEDRTHELREAMESVMTRVTKLEMASQQQQQVMQVMEGMGNDTARRLLTKLVNVFLTILAVILVCISTAARILAPFIGNRLITVVAVLTVLAGIVLNRHWDAVTEAWHQGEITWKS